MTGQYTGKFVFEHKCMLWFNFTLTIWFSHETENQSIKQHWLSLITTFYQDFPIVINHFISLRSVICLTCSHIYGVPYMLYFNNSVKPNFKKKTCTEYSRKNSRKTKRNLKEQTAFGLQKFCPFFFVLFACGCFIFFMFFFADWTTCFRKDQ